MLPDPCNCTQADYASWLLNVTVLPIGTVLYWPLGYKGVRLIKHGRPSTSIAAETYTRIIDIIKTDSDEVDLPCYSWNYLIEIFCKEDNRQLCWGVTNMIRQLDAGNVVVK